MTPQGWKIFGLGAAALATCVACSGDESRAELASDAGAVDAAPSVDDVLRVVVESIERPERRVLPNAVTLVEQAGMITASGETSDDGSFGAEVDWELGPASVTVWRQGYSAQTYVGVTRENILAQGGELRIAVRALGIPNSVVRVSGIPSEGTATLQSFTHITATSYLPVPSIQEPYWSIAGEEGLPLEIIYQHRTLGQSQMPDDTMPGYEPYAYDVEKWWRIVETNPKDGARYEEDRPSPSMQALEPEDFRLSMEPSADAPPSVWARAIRPTDGGRALMVGLSYRAAYEANRFTVKVSGTDQVHEPGVYTEVAGYYNDGSSSLFNLEGAGEDRDLGKVDWLVPPSRINADANQVEWQGTKGTNSTIVVSTVATTVPDGSPVAQWAVSTLPGMDSLAWPNLPTELDALLAGELRFYVYSCEPDNAFGCRRSAYSTIESFTR
jgi:hypothetical protein